MQDIILDISRSISRVSQGKLTGIDRVELAYIRHFITRPTRAYFLARIQNNCFLLDQSGMQKLFALIIESGPWDSPKFLSLKRNDLAAKILATTRRLAISSGDISRILATHVSSGFIYINVGHGAMKPKVWPKLREAGAAKIIFLIHDVIPLDFPQFCRPEATMKFSTRLRAAAKHADILIFNSTDTANRTQKWLAEWGLKAEGHVVLLGTDPLPDTTLKPPPSHPYFVTIGTIEPRKNHRLLLDIWTGFHDNMPAEKIPHLYIVGARGWLNEEVFRTLDTADYMGKTVYECGRISDKNLAELLQNATALLFPSFAEGFGYPLVEALQKQVPVICSPLESFKELAKDNATYIAPNNPKAWARSIISYKNTENLIQIRHTLPDWGTHLHKIDIILANIAHETTR